MELLDSLQNLSITDVNDQKRIHFKSLTAEIDSIITDIVYADYSSKTIIIATQYQKIGGLISIERDQVHNPLGSADIFTTKVIFGSVSEQQEIAARFLAEQIKITKPLLLFLSLKCYDIETVKAIKDIIIDIKSE